MTSVQTNSSQEMFQTLQGLLDQLKEIVELKPGSNQGEFESEKRKVLAKIQSIKAKLEPEKLSEDDFVFVEKGPETIREWSKNSQASIVQETLSKIAVLWEQFVTDLRGDTIATAERWIRLTSERLLSQGLSISMTYRPQVTTLPDENADVKPPDLDEERKEKIKAIIQTLFHRCILCSFKEGLNIELEAKVMLAVLQKCVPEGLNEPFIDKDNAIFNLLIALSEKKLQPVQAFCEILNVPIRYLNQNFQYVEKSEQNYYNLCHKTLIDSLQQARRPTAFSTFMGWNLSSTPFQVKDALLAYLYERISIEHDADLQIMKMIAGLRNALTQNLSSSFDRFLLKTLVLRAEPESFQNRLKGCFKRMFAFELIGTQESAEEFQWVPLLNSEGEMRQLIEGTEMLKGEFRQLDQKLENWRARLLNALRQILNLKVTEIAVQLGDVSWKELEDMETGKARLSLTVAKRLMELYHCDPQLI